MNEQDTMAIVKECADLFYQNSEKAAYESLAGIIPQLNQKLQELTGWLAQIPEQTGAEMQQKVLADLRELITAYQYRDGMALADLLYYDIFEEIELLEKLKQGAGQ